MAKDILVKYIEDSRKFDIRSTRVGQVQTVEGRQKNIQQILRAIFAKSTQASMQDAQLEARDAGTTVYSALQILKSKQVKVVNSGYPELVGWKIYRGVGDEFQLISGDLTVAHTFTDEDLSNGELYFYGIKRVALLGGIQVEEADFVNIFAVVPSGAQRYQKWLLQSHVLVRPGDQQVQFWLNTNTIFYGDELIRNILGVTAVKPLDPRQVRLRLTIEDFNQERMPLNTSEL